MCRNGEGSSGWMYSLGAAASLITTLFAFTLRSDDVSLVGHWQGAIKVGPVELHLVFHVKKDDKGALVALMDSPDQGAKDIPVKSASLDKKAVSFKLPDIAGEFAGSLAEDGKSIDGEWKQAGQAFKLVLKRVDKATELRRPQTPKPPFPYVVEEVRIENKADKTTLAGTLTLPKGNGPFPAVVMITGSGPQDRDETIFGHRPFFVIADDLTRKGFAVLRVDDRGVGGSTGDPKTATTEDYARDVESEIAYLKTRKEVDRYKIGLIGHSEGGIIAPLVASRTADVAFIVLLAGTGVNGEEIMLRQAELLIKEGGGKEEDLKRQRELQLRLFELVKTEKDPAVAADKMKTLIKDAYQALPEDVRKALGDTSAAADVQVKMIASPWMRFFMTYDPRFALAKVKCPILAINGEKDLQVDPKQNLPEIEKAIRSGGNKRVTIVEVPGVNHLFQTCKTGTVAEYGSIEETIAPSVLKTLSDWLTRQTK